MTEVKNGDNYADGKAAKVWNVFIGDEESRTKNYKDFICDLLKSSGCRRVLDVACGTGVDSVMLVEAGFQVTSVDASDQMLKYALRTRWNRKKEPGFENWAAIEILLDLPPLDLLVQGEANKAAMRLCTEGSWSTSLARNGHGECLNKILEWDLMLQAGTDHMTPKYNVDSNLETMFPDREDWLKGKVTLKDGQILFTDWSKTDKVIEEANWLTLTQDVEEFTEGGFDAVICLGNSFTHILDPTGDQHDQRLALVNFKKMLRPGGILIIDHRNYDHVLDGGAAPSKSIYYNSKTKADIRTSVLYEGQEAKVIMFDYSIDPTNGSETNSIPRTEFRLTLFPHRLPKINKLLDDVFGPKSTHTVYGDFKPLNEVQHPGFYVHVLQKM